MNWLYQTRALVNSGCMPPHSLTILLANKRVDTRTAFCVASMMPRLIAEGSISLCLSVLFPTLTKYCRMVHECYSRKDKDTMISLCHVVLGYPCLEGGNTRGCDVALLWLSINRNLLFSQGNDNSEISKSENCSRLPLWRDPAI